jgi:type IV secretory pathway VirD2 relaxase
MFAITRQPAFQKYTSNIKHDCTSRVGGTMSRDDDLRIRLGRVRDRGRVRRVKPFIAQALAAAEKAGGFKRRSGHGARTSTFGRGRAASFAAATRRTERARGAMVKARVVRHGIKRAPLSAHLEYLRRDGVTKDDTPGRMFDAEQDSADHRAFAGRCTDDRHHFRFIVSPDDAEQLSDLKAFTRDLMRQAERDLGTRLDWVAVDHWNTEHPHIHVIVRGVVDDGRDLVISRDYISQGLRARAGELVTLELGPRSDLDIHRRLDAEIEADRWTKLDRVLAAEAAQHDRIVDLRPERDQASDGDTRSALVGRMRKLERLGLAKELGPARWYLSERAEPILRALGERNDIIKRIHQGLAEQRIERSVSNYVLEQEDPARPIIGRLVARGLDDELRETAYAVKRVGKIALIMHQRYAQGLAAHQWMLLTNGPAQSAYPIIARFSQVYTIQLSPSRLTSPRRDALAPVRISTPCRILANRSPTRAAGTETARPMVGSFVPHISPRNEA